MAKETDKIKATLLRKGPPAEAPILPTDWLSTGSGLLNLSLSGHIQRGFCKGRYFYFVGDSDSGKSMFTQTCFAEAAINPNFNKYRFLFYNREGGALMDYALFFGQRAADRVEVIRAETTVTLQSFYYHLAKQLQGPDPIIAVADSWDAFTAEGEDKKFASKSNAGPNDKTAGDYGMEKAKLNSQNMPRIVNLLRKTGSIFIGISQTREDINAGNYGDGKTRAGGKALKFYAALEMWTSSAGKLTKAYKGQFVQQGIVSRIHVRKNRLTGKEWTVTVPIYHSNGVGIDDVGSLVDFLVLWKHWPKEADKNESPNTKKAPSAADLMKGKITAVDFEFAGSREAIVRKIQADGLELELRSIVSEVWNQVEQAAAVQRNPRYV